MSYLLNTILIFLLFEATYTSHIALNDSHHDHHHPNVLFIIIDDLRPTLGCYGDKLAVTPNIDKLAYHGTIFTRAYAQQALCGPSRTSFLTSRRPHTTRLIDVHYYWRSHAGNYTTLPQYFREHGYHTAAAGKVFHPGIASNHSDDQPYSWSETPYHPSSQAHKQDPVCPSPDGALHTNIYCPVDVDKQPEKTLPDIQTTEFVRTWLRRRRKTVVKKKLNEPFFLAVGFHKPHIPLKFPKEFLKYFPIKKIKPAPNNYRPRGLPDVAWNPWNDLRRRDDITALNVSFPYGPIPDHYSRYIRQGYYAATAYTDTLVGDVIRDTLTLFPNTIITLIGDHGWSLGEHQEWSKFSNFEVSTRVPFIVSLPQQRNKDYLKKQSPYNAGHQSGSHKYHSPVELLDVFPTLVDLSGLSALDTCPQNSTNITLCTEGVSLSPIITRGPYSDISYRHCSESENHILHKECLSNLFSMTKTNVAFSQYPRPGVAPSKSPDSDQPRLTETTVMGHSLRTSRFRYTAWLKFNHTTFTSSWKGVIAEELYDHLFDPQENNNIVRKQFYSSYVHDLRNRLKKVVEVL